MIFSNLSRKKNVELVSIKTYHDLEWFNHEKKYRSVFDRSETTYIRCEVALLNKLYQEKDQTIVLKFKCFAKAKNNKDKELCCFEEKYTINKDEAIAYIREGWGNKNPGAYWTLGNYYWEIYLEKEKIATKEFFVEDVGIVTPTNNPFFDIENIQLFNEGSIVEKINKIKPLCQFNKNTIRFIYTDLIIKNKSSIPYYAEVTFRYLDINGYIKGETTIIDFVDINPGEIYHLYSGWGKNEPDQSFPQSTYFVDILFMGQIIARAKIDIGNNEIEGQATYWKGNPFLKDNDTTQQISPFQNSTPKNLDQIIAELNSLIGLEQIKAQIQEHILYIKYLNLKKEKGIDSHENVKIHSVFTGNPGTGKTTVVKLLGEIYKTLGILSKGHVIEVGRSELVAEYIGQTAPKVKEVIEKARGGILFIDEAYSLFREDDSKDFGKEVIEVLIKEMSDGKGDIAIMVAGYPQEMDNFLNSNPGLKSRFSYYFNFPDYTPEELLKIIEVNAQKMKISLTEKAKDEFSKMIINDYRNRDKTFGNARYAVGLLNEAKINMARRLMNLPNPEQLSKEELTTIDAIDVLEIYPSQRNKIVKLAIDEPLLNEGLTKLNSLIGLYTIKKEINEMIKLIRYYNEIGKPIDNVFSMHYIFTGNPGTGKTTVARILGNIFRALGILEKGHVIEVDRSELVAGYIGQTALKTEKVIPSAMGVTLFNDEAYSLTYNKDGQDFGKEAIEILLKEMEDNRNKFSVIVAGYTKPMNEFINANPGLKSRFDKTFYFSDYNNAELFEIAKNFLEEENLILSEESQKLIVHFIEKIPRDGSSFGNAREIRKLTELIIRKHFLRLAEVPIEQQTDEFIKTILPSDIPQLIEIYNETHTNTIGFRKHNN
ncbi:MAG: AAA family ATPase [Bacteroidales bacterium]|nr:AAA family ATPase [Bacteroidales bacterium]